MTRLAIATLTVHLAAVVLAGEGPSGPTAAQLRAVVLAEHTPKIDSAKTAKLRAALEEHAAEFVSRPRWAPYHEWRGISASHLAMTEPAETIHALSLAYPYVSDELKPKVKAYLEREFATARPYELIDYPDALKGAQRNFHRIDRADYAASSGRPLVRDRKVKLYPLYVFASATDNWKLIDGVWPKIRAAAAGIDGKLVWVDANGRRDLSRAARMANNGRNVSSMIGYARMAGRLGRRADLEAAMAKLRPMVLRMLEFQRAIGAECLKHIDAPPGREGHPSQGGQFRSAGGPYVGATHRAAIVYWTDLCPQLGRLLRQFAPAALRHVADWMLRNAQGFYLVRGDVPVQEGEVFAPYYLTTMNYFHVISTIRRSDFHTHRQLADAPACRADVYYLERLVRAIEASGR